jgi:hypothetical protein
MMMCVYEGFMIVKYLLVISVTTLRLGFAY